MAWTMLMKVASSDKGVGRLMSGLAMRFIGLTAQIRGLGDEERFAVVGIGGRIGKRRLRGDEDVRCAQVKNRIAVLIDMLVQELSNG